jgi:23S rRNA (guanine745-N1)-methyltransferase
MTPPRTRLGCQVALLVCPSCRAELAETGSSLRCPAGHTYDIAREGYVNLLGGRALAATVGDAPEMLRARRRFLARGFYTPLSEAIGEIGLDLAQGADREPDAPFKVLEAGSGEGYYLGMLHRTITDLTDEPVCALGVDVSKHAARMAARSFPDVLFVVADVTRPLPIADAAIDLLLNLFAPRNPAEFARVVRPGGSLVVAIPDPDHLAEVRPTLNLLDIEPDKEARVIERHAPMFRLVRSQRVSIALTLDATAVSDLLDMTPNYRHRDRQLARPLDDPKPISATARFTVLMFQRAA